MRQRLVLLTFLCAGTLWPGASAAQQPGEDQRIIVLVDSGSATARMTTDLRTGLLAFLDDVPGNPEMMLITTGGQMQIRAKVTTDREVMKKAAGELVSTGGSNRFVDALLESYQRFLKPEKAKRPVYVIVTTEVTAGRDGDVNVDSYNAFAREFKAQGGRAHAIVIGGLARGVTTTVAEHITSNTGGRFERIANSTAVTNLLRDIATRVITDP